MTLEDIEFSAGRPGSDIPPPGLSLATGDPPSPSDDGRHDEHADDGPRSSPSLFLQDVSLTDRSDNQSSDRSPRSVATLFDSWNTMSKGSIAHGHATPQGNESPADSPTGETIDRSECCRKALLVALDTSGSPHSPFLGAKWLPPSRHLRQVKAPKTIRMARTHRMIRPTRSRALLEVMRKLRQRRPQPTG